VQQTGGDGDGVADGQADDADRGKGREGAAAAQVDQAEQHLDDGQQDERPHGHAQPAVDTRPQAGQRDGVVAGKGPGGAGRGDGDADGAEERDDEDGHHQAQAAAGAAHDDVEDVGDGLAVGGLDDVCQRREREADGQDEEEAGEAAHGYAEAHGLRHFDGRVGALLGHGRDHADGGEGVGGGQQADEEGEAAPAGEAGVVVSQGVGGAVAAGAGLDGQGDEDGEDGEGDEGRADSVELGQEAVAQGADGEGEEADGVEDEQQLPAVGGPAGVVHGDGGGDERGKAEVDGQGDGPVANEPDPAVDEGEHGAGARRGHLEGPVVGAGGRGIARGQLAQRQRDALVDDEHDEPADEDGQRAAAVDGAEQRAALAVGDGGDGQQLEEQREHGAVAAQLLRVAQAVEALDAGRVAGVAVLLLVRGDGGGRGLLVDLDLHGVTVV